VPYDENIWCKSGGGREVEMTVPWPEPERRERYVEFLTLELLIMKSAARGEVDSELLGEFEALLRYRFPRTRAFIGSRLSTDPAKGFSDEIRAVAWAEARAVANAPQGPGPGGAFDGRSRAAVPGEWTEEEIAGDINDCFAEARKRAGL
jgi:hypothetical protein